MKLPRQRSDEQRAIERARAAGPLDSGETRAIMIGAVVLTIFLYFIKLILLPFVLAGIVAYILTPVLDWAARSHASSRWLRSTPRHGAAPCSPACFGPVTPSAMRSVAS